VVLTDNRSSPYDAILKISNDDITGNDRPIDFVFDSRCLLSALSSERTTSSTALSTCHLHL